MPALILVAVEALGAALIAAGVEAGITVLALSTQIATGIQILSAVYTLRDQQLRAERKARDAYNASLRDRYAMVRSSVETRQVVLGRQRVSGPVAYIGSYGNKLEHLVYVVVLAAHEIDAIETVYFGDEPVTLDSSGNVIGVRRNDAFSIAASTGTFTLSSLAKIGSINAVALYGTDSVTLTVGTVTTVGGASQVAVSGARSGQTGLLTFVYQPDPCPYVVQDTASKTEYYTPSTQNEPITLTSDPDPNTVSYWQTTGGGDNATVSIVPFTVAGRIITPSGATAGATAAVAYQSTTTYSRARVRKYLGAPGQAADADMITNQPGIWTSAHAGAGLAYLVIECDYDPGSFPTSIPMVSAIVRGLKCVDPRTGTTAWTDNPAMLIRAYALHPLGGRMLASQLDDTSIIAAANVCDASTTYTMGGNPFVRPLYAGSTVAKAGNRPTDTITELAQAMGGRWCMVDGLLKVKAGAYTAPVMAMDEAWLSDTQAVQVQTGRARADMANAMTGTFADQSASFKVTPYPKVIASAYVTLDGTELPTDAPMGAVTFSGQAQHIAACQLRYIRQGVIVKMACNLRAYQLEPFDVVSITLARYGWVSKTFEVLDTSWTLDGGIELTAKEIDPSIWDMAAGFTATDPAPNTRLASPWDVPQVAGLSLLSDVTTLQKQPDGSKATRILASWAAQTDKRVTQAGGSIELRWGLATDPETKWQTVSCPGTATSAYLAPVHTGSSYIAKARSVTGNGMSNWCVHALCAVATTSTFDGTVDWATQVVGAAAVNAAITAAAGSASAALARLASIESDSILSPGEKPSVVADYALITSKQAGIDAQATNYAVTTEKTNYDNAITALTSYMGNGTTTGLIGWNVIPGSDVAINGATFHSKFADVYTAEAAVLKTVSDNAKSRLGALALVGAADFSTQVTGSGKPANNATVGATFGVNISGTARTADISPGAISANVNSSTSVSVPSLPNSSSVYNTGSIAFSPSATLTAVGGYVVSTVSIDLVVAAESVSVEAIRVFAYLYRNGTEVDRSHVYLRACVFPYPTGATRGIACEVTLQSPLVALTGAQVFTMAFDVSFRNSGGSAVSPGPTASTSYLQAETNINLQEIKV